MFFEPFPGFDLLSGFRRGLDINGDGIATLISFWGDASGVRLQHFDGRSVDRTIEMPGRHVVFGDLDGDGRIDALVSPSKGDAVWLRGLDEDWFDDTANAAVFEDLPVPALWDAQLEYVNDDPFADIVHSTIEDAIGVRLGRGEGSFAPLVEIPTNGAPWRRVAGSRPGRLLVWEEDPKTNFDGRHIQLHFGEELEVLGMVVSDWSPVTYEIRDDFDQDGDVDVIVPRDGIAVLKIANDDSWVEVEFGRTRGLSVGEYDAAPGKDLLLANADDGVRIIRNFAEAPAANPEPLRREFPEGTPKPDFFFDGVGYPAVGDGIDSYLYGSSWNWLHGRVTLCR